MRRITIWERKVWKKINDEKILVVEHNHIEDSWNSRPRPTSNCDVQKRAWKDAIWVKKFGYLSDDKIPKMVENE